MVASDNLVPIRYSVRYHVGMTIQIAVRLPDAIVAFVDEEVVHGNARSRADVVARALAREQRRVIAERDAAILGASATGDDLDDLVAWTSANPVDVDAD